MTTEELEKLERLAKSAAPGKWQAEYGVSLRSAWAIQGDGRAVLHLDDSKNIALDAETHDVEETLRFVEAARPEVVLDLVSEIRRRRAVQVAAEQVLQAVAKHIGAADMHQAGVVIPELRALRAVLDVAGRSDEWGPPSDPALLERAIEACRHYYAGAGRESGGSLHIVLEDGNSTRGALEMCLQMAKENGDRAGAELAQLLLQLTEDQLEQLVEGGYELYAGG